MTSDSLTHVSTFTNHGHFYISYKLQTYDPAGGKIFFRNLNKQTKTAKTVRDGQQGSSILRHISDELLI